MARMNNVTIIDNACETNGIEEAVDTYNGWKRKGYQVQKGSKAVFKVAIWMPKKHIKGENDILDENEAKPEAFYLKTASFFTFSQVKAIA